MDKLEVYADQDLLEQVWLNLITNAIKYTQHNGIIDITMNKNDNEMSVSIRDTGKGIPPKAIQNLFDRFYKVDKARSSSVAGNGLGLSIVKKILSIHQYSLRFQVKKEMAQSLRSVFLIRKQRKKLKQYIKK
ncbi:sensor histidine kinase [Halalkalibacter lacteus]|uniref:sensor histidine kinase n=1 Tax=Halalkalibacter lacteus TaxID=3090663 RepID=UPI002FCA3488